MRRKAAPKKKIIPDAKFDSILVTKCINRLMKHGKKSVVEKSLYKTFLRIEKKYKKCPLEVFDEVMKKIIPLVEVRSRRIGGATYQIPTEVNPGRGLALGLQWFSKSVRRSSGRNLCDKIFATMVGSLDGKSWAVKKREEVFKMAESNKAFSHYRW